MFTPDQTDLGGVHVMAGGQGSAVQCRAGWGRLFMVS
jgi:hypothetical protein